MRKVKIITYIFSCFFFNNPKTTAIYTLSLHDALPIYMKQVAFFIQDTWRITPRLTLTGVMRDRKSTRLNSSHLGISYAVFCLKKKKTYVIIKPSIGTKTWGSSKT